MPYANNDNSGALYVISRVGGLVPQFITTLTNELLNDSAANSASVAAYLITPSQYIQACNNGLSQACTIAYNNGYNQSCSQIYANWVGASNGNYFITGNYMTAGNVMASARLSPLKSYCNMTSPMTAAISGCNGNIMGDCDTGYTKNYNQSCASILSNWPSEPGGTFNVTPNGTPDINLGGNIMQATCPANMACVTNNIAATQCSDGTYYVGTICPNGSMALGGNLCSGGVPLFVPSSYLGPAQYSNDTNALGAMDTINGKNNIAVLTADGSPAEALCTGMSAYGHNDWYLPSAYELRDVGNTSFSTLGFPMVSTFWASSEYSTNMAYGYQGSLSFYTKTRSQYVLCMGEPIDN